MRTLGLEITDKLLKGVKKLGDEATFNFFMGVMFTIASTHKGDRELQIKYERMKALVKRCRFLEKTKQTDITNYNKYLEDTEKSIRGLLAHINYKNYAKKKP